jgi:methylglyoxal synthase
MLNGRKVLALIAHDGKKANMVAFATFNREKLADYRIIATATTGRLLREAV